MLVLALLCFVAFVSSQSSDCTGFTYQSQSAWGAVDCNDNICGVGQTQSPVQVSSRRDASGDELSQLRFRDYADASGSLEIDGQTIIYRYTAPDAQMRNLHTNEVVFEPKHMLVHIPPEHVLPSHADAQPDMEIQFYHASVDGIWSVVSFFLRVTEDQTDFWNFLNPEVIKDASGIAVVNITGVQEFFDTIQFAHQDSYYFYEGSLTQPPCTEPVYWQLMDTVMDINLGLFNALEASLYTTSNGNARDIQRTLNSVLFWDSSANAVTDPVCGGGFPNWNAHPYACTDQYEHTTCFYCSGRANNMEAKNVCLNRNGRECNELFSSPEAKAYCNIAFECPASTFSQPFFLLAILSVLLAVKNFW